MKKRYLIPLFLLPIHAPAQELNPGDRLAQEEKTVSISDGTFREYRLAVLFTREEFESPRFDRSMDKIKAHLQELEDYLNSIYVRDAGVKFTMVYDDRLIAKDLPSNQVYIDNAATATKAISSRIGSESYDIGVVCNYYGSDDAHGVAGLTSLGCLQWDDLKGNVVSSKQDNRTIAHELAHAFGCEHPWVTGSEPGQSGQSIAGYGFSSKTHFLSLASLEQLLSTAQKADKMRHASKQTVSDTNTAPCIDRDRMKREYVVPRNTFFTLPVYAADNEQDVLHYASAQWDFLAYKAAYFPTFPSQQSHVLQFGRTYSSANMTLVPHTDALPVGDYKMLLSVSDALPVDEAVAKSQAPLRDNYLTMIRVVDVDKPFKINPVLKTEFATGERVTLKWDVDSTFFHADSKVRVLLSDDGGETFRHVLVPEAPNNGQCEVVMPQQPIGKKETWGIDVAETGEHVTIFEMGKAVLRLEVVGQGFYDITDNDPHKGSVVLQSNIRWEGLPASSYVRVADGDECPEVPAITASKNGAEVAVDYTTTTDGRMTRRLWVASDGTDESAYVQWIERVPVPDPITVEFAEKSGGASPFRYLATFSAPHAMALPEGVTAYYVGWDASEECETMLLPFEADVLPPYQGFVLASESGETVELRAAADDATVKKLPLRQSLLGHSAGEARRMAAENHAYVLEDGPVGLAFYRTKADTLLPANKAYLHLPDSIEASVWPIHRGDDVTGVVTVPGTRESEKGPFYDLSGRRVAVPIRKGVYIRRGRKVLR